MTRGDTESILVGMEFGGFVPGDKVEFTARRIVDDPIRRIYKCVTEFTEDGKALIALWPEDTKHLRARSYVYDVQVTFADGTVDTPIKPPEAVLVLEGDVTE